MESSKAQRQYIHKLCRYDKEAKEEAVAALTGGRTDSTSSMTFNEANHLIKRLGGTPLPYDNWALFNNKKASHKLILSLAIQLQWSVWNDKYGAIADLERISEWLKSNKSPVNKPLMNMSPEEVSKIIVAFENMIKKRYKK